jgi:hypothetical protein
MKRVFFLLIGILAFSVACQDNFVEPENELSAVEKSAKFEKVKTFPVKGWINIIPDPDAPMFSCTPEQFGIEMCSSGWIKGIETILGKIVEEKSTYEKQSCDVTMTDAGPVIHNVVTAKVTYACGDIAFCESHTFINPVTGEVWGQTDVLDGTGRYEGATGTMYQLNGKMLPEGGLSWEVEGYVTLVLK